MDVRQIGDQRREKMMDFITEYMIRHGYAPSIREIGKAVGLSSINTVAHHIEILIEEGKLLTDAEKGSARAFTVAGYEFRRIK